MIKLCFLYRIALSGVILKIQHFKCPKIPLLIRLYNNCNLSSVRYPGIETQIPIKLIPTPKIAEQYLILN